MDDNRQDPVGKYLYRKVEKIRSYAYRPNPDAAGADYSYWYPEYHPGLEPPEGWFRIDYNYVYERVEPQLDDKAATELAQEAVLPCSTIGSNHYNLMIVRAVERHYGITPKEPENGSKD